MDFKEFDMIWGGNVGILLQINNISTHGHQRYLKPPPTTSKYYPKLHVGIQLPLKHFCMLGMSLNALNMIEEGKMGLIL